MELARQVTVINLNMEQAANAAVQTTLDYNQLQLLELSIQGTDYLRSEILCSQLVMIIAHEELFRL